MAAGLDPFKMLRTSSGREEYGTVVEILCHALYMDDALELLPFLKGTLAEVLKREDEQSLYAKSKVKKKSSAFAKFTGPEAAATSSELRPKAIEEADGSRRWQRLLRAMFNAEAACALLDEVLAGYKTEEFMLAGKSLNDSWGPYDVYDDQMQAINALCLEKVLGAVLLRYGFTWDERGNQDISTIIATLATTSMEVQLKQANVQRQVFGCFTSLGSGGLGETSVTRGGLTGVKMQGSGPSAMDELDGAGDLEQAQSAAQGASRILNKDAIARAAAAENGYAATPEAQGCPKKAPVRNSDYEREEFPEDSD